MACKAVPDERSRLTTILVVPLMNCMAKIPLYLLLIGVFFAAYKATVMFFISTISLLMALPIARLLSKTVLKNKESAPLIMEMPSYHLPTISGVLRSTWDRLWIFLKKIITVVAAVMVVLFVLLRLPSPDQEVMKGYQEKADRVIAEFLQKAKQTEYKNSLQNREDVLSLISFGEQYKKAAGSVASRKEFEAVNQRFSQKNPAYFQIVKRGRKKQ